MRRSSYFWAAFLILGGALMLVRNLFNLRFSSFAVLFALGLILLGLYVLTGGKGGFFGGVNWGVGGSSSAQGGEHTVLFSQSNVQGSSDTYKYTVCFSGATIRLPDDAPAQVRVDAVFGEAVVILPPGRQTRVRMSAAFGETSSPMGNAEGFGSREALIGEGEPLELQCSAVFGSLRVVRE